MSYRTITVSLKSLENAERLCKFAAMVARKYNAHLIGVHTIGSMQFYPDTIYATPAPLADAYHKDQKETSEQIKEIFQTVTGKEDFVSEWREIDLMTETADSGITADWLGSDLVIIGQSNPKHDRSDQHKFVERAVRESGRPVLVLPHSGNFETVGQKILLGWSATRESTRAAHDALPLIKEADETKIFWVGKKGKGTNHIEQSAGQLAVALDRHGAKVSILHVAPTGLAIGDELLNEASNSGADLIVTGGYGHSKIYDFVLGATTNHLLECMTVPVLLAH
jgi:nucleotide-binding universal stress UspA family protein